MPAAWKPRYRTRVVFSVIHLTRRAWQLAASSATRNFYIAAGMILTGGRFNIGARCRSVHAPVDAKNGAGKTEGGKTMRKVLVVMLIGGSLAAGMSNAFAMERDQFIAGAQPATSVTVAIATGSAAAAGGTGSIRIEQPEHDLK